MAAGVVGAHDVAGHGQDVAVVGVGDVGGDDATALDGRLHHHGGIGHAGDDAVAAREVLPVGFGAEGVFRHQRAPLVKDAGGEPLVAVGVDGAEAAAHHGHGLEAAVEGLFVRYGVHAAGQAAHDAGVVLRQL